MKDAFMKQKGEAMIKKIITFNEERNVTLTAYLSEGGWEYTNIPKRPAVLILPGGGYEYCSDREADPVAYAYLQEGYQAFVLRYSTGNEMKWPAPLADYEQAMETIQKHAEEWDIYPDKIAVIGFSAGGHLAGCAAVMAKNRPAAAILGYAVLKGEFAKQYCSTAPDVTESVDEETCPCFLFTSRTDNVIPVINTLDMMNALERKNINFEAHIYAYGSHGCSVANRLITETGVTITSRTEQWVKDSILWLRDILGDYTRGGFSEPKCRKYADPNREPFLSVECNYNLLIKNEKSARIVSQVMAEKLGPEMYREMIPHIGNMRISEVLAYGGVGEEDINAVNDALSQLSNPEFLL